MANILHQYTVSFLYPGTESSTHHTAKECYTALEAAGDYANGTGSSSKHMRRGGRGIICVTPKPHSKDAPIYRTELFEPELLEDGTVNVYRLEVSY